MTDREKHLLTALVYMAEQYLEQSDGTLDHRSMAAGEKAVEVLAYYGLVEINSGSRFVRWTEAGNRFRNSN